MSTVIHIDGPVLLLKREGQSLDGSRLFFYRKLGRFGVLLIDISAHRVCGAVDAIFHDETVETEVFVILFCVCFESRVERICSFPL